MSGEETKRKDWNLSMPAERDLLLERTHADQKELPLIVPMQKNGTPPRIPPLLGVHPRPWMSKEIAYADGGIAGGARAGKKVKKVVP